MIKTNKLIKLSDNHYVIIDNAEIKDVRPFNDYWHLEKGSIINQFPNYLTDLSECKLITHSTLMLGKNWGRTIPLTIPEIEEIVYGYSVDKMSLEKYPKLRTYLGNEQWNDDGNGNAFKRDGYINGFNAHRKLIAEKVTNLNNVNHLQWIYDRLIHVYGENENDDYMKKFKDIIMAISPGESWDILINENNKVNCTFRNKRNVI